MANVRYLPKYKNTVADLNTYHSFLLGRMTVGDCRIKYLTTFELILDANCPFPLDQNPRYVRLTDLYPLPPPPEERISPEKFQAYMKLYNYIMRDAGLLNRQASEESYKGLNDRVMRG